MGGVTSSCALPPSRLPAPSGAISIIGRQVSLTCHVSRVDTANTNGARRTRMTIIVFAQTMIQTTWADYVADCTWERNLLLDSSSLCLASSPNFLIYYALTLIDYKSN